MYVPSILTTPLRATGPVDPGRPDEARTSEWAMLDGELLIGIWECTPGTFHGVTADEDESMLMVSGRATVDHDGGTFDLSPGTLWTTPKGWASTWHVHQTVRKLYVIDRRGGADGSPAHLANAYTSPLGAPTPREPISGTPHEASASMWTHDRLDVGVWECTPGEFRFRRDDYQEVFCVLAGHATLHVDAADGRPGQAFELVPGAVLLTPSGLTGRWVVHETIRKAYTIVTD